MKNRKLYWLLREPKDARGQSLWTVGRIAEAIYSDRSTVNDALNNAARRGRKTRPKLARFFKKEFQTTWPQIFEALGWDESGKIQSSKFQVPSSKCQVSDNAVPHGKLHVEQMEPHAC